MPTVTIALDNLAMPIRWTSALNEGRCLGGAAVRSAAFIRWTIGVRKFRFAAAPSKDPEVVVTTFDANSAWNQMAMLVHMTSTIPLGSVFTPNARVTLARAYEATIALRFLIQLFDVILGDLGWRLGNG